MLARACAVLALLTCSGALAACTDSGVVGYVAPLMTDACTGDAECATGQRCKDDVCVACEQGDDDCEPSDGDSSCDQPDARCPECKGNGDCKDAKCMEGVCRPDDESDDPTGDDDDVSGSHGNSGSAGASGNDGAAGSDDDGAAGSDDDGAAGSDDGAAGSDDGHSDDR
jgi:hypothetical protein